MLNWLRRKGQRAEEEPAEGAVEQAPVETPPEPAAEQAPLEALPEPVVEQAPGEAQLEPAPVEGKRSFFGRMADLLRFGARVDEEVWDELEELLIQADVGVPTASAVLERVRARARQQRLTSGEQVRQALQEELIAIVSVEPRTLDLAAPLTLILMVGVNGVGKTTTIAKLGRWLGAQHRSVLLAAGDTFRAAAVDQLREWGQRTGSPVIAHQMGADPGAVVFDAIEAAEARHCDVVIVDTAGRLHTKFNLMEELKKISRVAAKRLPGAPHESLLVLDATTGQNGLVQAREFKQAVDITGVVLTKLDGTAKGGIAFAVCDQLSLPIKFIGTGERADSLAPFEPAAFVASLFE